jgi:hypothetical protein
MKASRLAGGAAARRVDHCETVRRCKDGREIDVSVTISPLRDATGQIVGASKIARDITAPHLALNAVLLPIEGNRWMVLVANRGATPSSPSRRPSAASVRHLRLSTRKAAEKSERRGCRASLACFLRRGDDSHLRSGRLIRLGQTSSHGLAQAGYIKIGAEGPAQIAIDDLRILGRPQPEK